MARGHTEAPFHFQLQLSTNEAAQSTTASDKWAEKASPVPAAAPSSHDLSSKQTQRQTLPMANRQVASCVSFCCCWTRVYTIRWGSKIASSIVWFQPLKTFEWEALTLFQGDTNTEFEDLKNINTFFFPTSYHPRDACIINTAWFPLTPVCWRHSY